MDEKTRWGGPGVRLTPAGDIARFDTGNLVRNLAGEWVPSIPEPIYGLGKVCPVCYQRFFMRAGYRGHYALTHIMKLEET